MTIVWYSISMTLTGDGVFNGFFSVDDTTDLVTAFYETINNSTDFNNSILANNNYQDADYKFINNNFTVGGTNINYMNYYNNQDSPGYNPAYAFFNLYKAGGGNIVLISATGDSFGAFGSVFSITPISDPSCFLNTCSILTDKGYIGISNIRKGDNVISAFTQLPTTVVHCGYRSVNLDVVEKINHPMVIQANHFKHNIPSKDVVLSGNHRIICPGFSPTTHLGIQVHKLHDFKILNTEEVLVLTNLPDVRYYHIEVEGGKNAVFCDGLPVETLEAGEWDEYTMTEN